MTPSSALLRAVLLEPPLAFEAYLAWKGMVNFEQLPSEDFLLLPLLYTNLAAQLNDELTPRLKGIYKQAWVRQQQRVAAQQRWLGLFKHHGLVYQSLDETSVDVLANHDLLVGNEVLALLEDVPQDWLLKNPQHLRRIWARQGWVALGSGLRCFAQASSEPWLHRLEHTGQERVWLARSWKTLCAVHWADWFDLAAERGLRKRLHMALEVGRQAGLHDFDLPQEFSEFDHAQHHRLKHPWRVMRAYHTWRIAQYQGRDIGLLSFLTEQLANR